MYDDLRDLHLAPGERLLWSGGPQRRPVFDAADVLAVPFSLLWCGFAIFWEVSVFRAGGPVFMLIWGTPFILIGVYIVAGRFVVRGMQLRSTIYVVTDRRVVETVRRPRHRVTEMYLRDLAPPVMKVRGDEATGSIAFGSFPSLSESLAEIGFSNRRGWSRAPRPIVLREIPQPRQVRDIIAAAQVAR